MQIQIIGSGEAFDSNLGNNSCLLSGPGCPNLLMDCGYQIPERLWRTGVHESLDGVALTHLHADHCFGLVPLLTRFWEEKRRRAFKIIGPRGTKRLIEHALDLGYPGIRFKLPFALEFTQVAEGSELRWKGLSFRFARSKHSVLNLAMRIEGRSGESVGVSGDGSMTEATRKLFSRVDVLLHECYTPEPVTEMHGDLASLIEFARGAEALGRIGVTHLARGHRPEIERAVRALARRDRRWFIAMPGDVIPVRAD